jgi:ribokinase
VTGRKPAAAAMSRRVIVVGSINVDLVVRVPRLPVAGETVGGGLFEEHQGGKGANQAVAARRLGARVEFVGAIGSDRFGDSAAAALAAEGVGLAELRRLPGTPSGVALILVDSHGENLLAVAPGANAALTVADVERSLAGLALTESDLLMVSHEIPTATARAALLSARRAGARSILNPAPAMGLERRTFGLADLLTPNRPELAELAVAEARRLGRPSPAGDPPDHQASSLLETNAEGEGPRRGVVVTLGAAGALVVARDGTATRIVSIPARPVASVDATGAGDAFNGALAAGLIDGRPLDEAVRRAVVAAGLATTRSGAREGMPTTAELDTAMGAASSPPTDTSGPASAPVSSAPASSAPASSAPASSAP